MTLLELRSANTDSAIFHVPCAAEWQWWQRMIRFSSMTSPESLPNPLVVNFDVRSYAAELASQAVKLQDSPMQSVYS